MRYPGHSNNAENLASIQMKGIQKCTIEFRICCIEKIQSLPETSIIHLIKKMTTRSKYINGKQYVSPCLARNAECVKKC